MTQRVLVTGGAGYIGSHTCRALHAAGFEPVTFDDVRRGHADAVRWGPLEVGDLRDPGRIADVLDAYQPIAVVHFAALAYVGESMGSPGRYYDNNVTGTLALLEACRPAGVDRLVFSSTCATYGVPTTVPIPDDHPQQPINPYGASKLMVERILADFDQAHALRSVCLRYFNAAGAHPEGTIGELHDPETHLIPLVLDAAAGRRSSITIFGEDFDTPDGTCIRDYVHVSDLADAHVLALRHLLGGGGSITCNLGTGHGSSVREVIATAEAVTGRAVPVEVGPRREGDPPELVADVDIAHRVLGWQPQRSDLRTILTDAWRWHRIVQRPDRGDRS